jgi:hypothetical protein
VVVYSLKVGDNGRGQGGGRRVQYSVEGWR